MKKLAIISIVSAIIACLLSACGAKKSAAVSVPTLVPDNEVHISGYGERVITSSPINVIPKATIFKMSGNYSHNLPINIRNGQLISFAAPTDINEDSAPLQLAEGWWLDRRGVTFDTAFSRYTLSEYSKLEKTPTTTTLMKSIIPGARVTALKILPMTLQEALADTAAVNKIIRSF